MKTLIIHLSDFHDSSEHPISDERINLLAAPIPALLPAPPTEVILLLGGDFVDQGVVDYYPQIQNKIEKISDSIKSNFPESNFSIVTVPGNHDINFSEPDEIRDSLIPTFQSNNDRSYSGKIVNALVAPQIPFFEFQGAIQQHAKNEQLSPSIDSRIAWGHHLGATKTIQVSCINTSFLSQKRESPGQIFLPTNIPSPKSKISIALLHHPLNWVEAWNAITIREWLFSNHSYIFTGHEHRGDVLKTSLVGSGSASVIEAPIFWAKNQDDLQQGFSVVYIDDASEEELIFQLLWSTEGYKPYLDGTQVDQGQTLLPIKVSQQYNHSSTSWRFTNEFEQYINSTNLLLTHSGKSNISLSDIFVYPDVRELTPESEYKKSRLITGKNLINDLRKKPIAFVIGADQSGKTGLAKTVLKDLVNLGDVPIMIDGAKLPPQSSKYRSLVNELCSEQYGIASDTRLANTPLEKKVIIVDNYHYSPKAARREHRILEMLNTLCSRIIVFCKDSALSPADLATFAIDSRFSISVINTLPFAKDAQRELVHKWLMLDSELALSPEKFAQREVASLQMIGGMVGNGHIQSYPPYLIAILQSAEAGNPVDVTASTHGHLYEAFITAALSRRRSLTNHSILTSFTSFLAYAAFEDDLSDFGEDFIIQTHKKWQEATDSNRSLSKLRNELINLRFLTEVEGHYKFSEKFIYYYFSALYIKDHLESESCRNTLKECVLKIWVEDYANILLFLAHLSKDSFVVKELVNTANAAFDEFQPADLKGQILFSEQPEITHKGNCPDWIDNQTRDDDLDQLAHENQLQKMPVVLDRTSQKADLDFIGQICANLKIVQILGQFVKNYPASFDPDQKKEIVEGCVALGLRTLGGYLTIVDKEKKEVLSEFASIISGKKTNISKAEADQSAKVALTNLCLISSFGVIKRISYAIGSPELENTYKRVFSDNEEAPSRELVSLSVKLDHAGAFPEQIIKNSHQKWDSSDPFANLILRALVSRHFRIFDVPRVTRQSVGSHLNLSQNTIFPRSNREKLMSPAKKH